eukprot:Gregarina_sp_Poly_1__5762@NODE_302_length_9747_cov_161_916736_g261_i0_p1_GENE_NODE_302_length_9747_cov_161_916736_g261_i0NODE_302_length_9747_cov_161_916736_g261_i0_p1_ORF_typecomplete_len1399_score238_62SAC3_GANP/PF03399_16/1e52_NODE_302_length_9747_cov_161_916736_g261_i02594197
MIDKQRTCTANDLERLNVSMPTDARLVNKHLAVKSFQRSDASKVFLPGDTRPVLWCRRTVHNVLMLQIEADCANLPWLYRREDTPYRFLDVYNFVRDRLRSVWTDLTVQHCQCHRGTIESLEISSRFLILAEELLCEDAEFDAVQNGSLLSTCLEKLMACYAAVRRFQLGADFARFRSSQTGSSILQQLNPHDRQMLVETLVWESPYEAEFWSYRLLLCLSHGEQSSASVNHVLSQVPKALLTHPCVRVALAAITAFKEGNVLRYFKYQRKSPYLMSLLMNKFGNLLRMRFLYIVSGGSRPQSTIPFGLFLKLFNFEGEPHNVVQDFCDKNEIQVLTNTQTGAPENVSVGAVSVSLEDLRPRRLRCRRFRSQQLSHKFNTLRLTRKQLLDPLLSSDDLTTGEQSLASSGISMALSFADFPQQQPTRKNGSQNGQGWKGFVGSFPKMSTTPMFKPPFRLGSPSVAKETPSPEPLFALGSLAQSPVVLSASRVPPRPEKHVPRLVAPTDQLKLSQPFGNLVGEGGTRRFAELAGAETASPGGNDQNEPPAAVPHFGWTEESVETDALAPPLAVRPQKRKQAEVNSKRQPLRRDGDAETPAGDSVTEEEKEDFKKKSRRADPVSWPRLAPSELAPASPLVPSTEAKTAAAFQNFKTALGTELHNIAGASACAANLLSDIEKVVQTVQMMSDFNDTSADWAIEAIGATGSPRYAGNEIKLWDWNLCICENPSPFGPNALKVAIEAALFGVSFSSTRSQGFDGALSEWSGNPCASFEIGPGYVWSQWFRNFRLRDRSVVSLLSTSAPHFCDAWDKKSTLKFPGKFHMVWIFSSPILVKKVEHMTDPTSDDSAAKKYKLCPGMAARVQEELEAYALALAGSDKALEGTACFMVQIDIVTTASSGWSSKRLTSKANFFERMNFLLSQKLAVHLRKVGVSASHPASVSKMIEKTLATFEATQDPFVFITALGVREVTTGPILETPSRKRPGNFTERANSQRHLDSGETNSSKRWSSWPDVARSADATVAAANGSPRKGAKTQLTLSEFHFVPLGLHRALGATSLMGRQTLQGHYSKLREVKKGAALSKLFRELPLKLHWIRRTTETLPFILTTLWKREIATLTVSAPSIEVLVQALPRGIKSFYNSSIWDMCYVKSPARSVPGISDSEEEDEEETDAKILINESSTLILKNKAVIQRVLKKTEKLISKLCSSKNWELFQAIDRNSPIDLFRSEGSSEGSAAQSSSVAAETSCFYEARKFVRGIIKYAMDPENGKAGLPYMRVAFRLPYPLYLSKLTATIFEVTTPLSNVSTPLNVECFNL